MNQNQEHEYGDITSPEVSMAFDICGILLISALMPLIMCLGLIF
jgi:hypothetical protein